MRNDEKKTRELFIDDLGSVQGGAGRSGAITTLALGEEDGSPAPSIRPPRGATTLALGEEDGGANL